MDMRQLHYVTTISEYRSFTKAAKALHVAQPSLSAYIAKAETELGVILFDRSTSPLTLTYAGEQYIKNAKRILEITTNMQKEFRDISENLKGKIHVGIPRDRAAFMMPAIMKEYNSIYPGIKIHIREDSTANLLNFLYGGKIDIAIIPDTVTDSNVQKEDIYAEELLLVSNDNFIGEGHLIDGLKGHVDISKIQDMPLITLRKGHGIRDAIEKLFASNGAKPNVIMETSSNITAFRLASAGIGIAIVPEMTVKLVREVEDISFYSITAIKASWNIVSAYRKDSFVGIAEKTLLSVARRAFTQ